MPRRFMPTETLDRYHRTQADDDLQQGLASVAFAGALPDAMGALEDAAYGPGKKAWEPLPIVVSAQPTGMAMPTAPKVADTDTGYEDPYAAPRSPQGGYGDDPGRTPYTPSAPQAGQGGYGDAQGQTAATPSGEIDNSSRESFARTAYPYALQAAKGDPKLAQQLIATAISENGSVGTGRPLGFGYNFGGIQGVTGTAPNVTALDAGNPRSFAQYNSPTEGFQAVANLVTTGRYKPAYDQYLRDGDIDAYWREVNAQGYAEDQGWAGKVNNIRAGQVAPHTANLPATPSGRPSAMPQQSSAPLDINDVAERYKGGSYVYGGGRDGQGGLPGAKNSDCSAFVSGVWREKGLSLVAHTDGAYNQLRGMGAPEVGVKDAQPGDVVFYMGAGTGGAISHHMGIYAGDGKVLDQSVSGGEGVKLRDVGHAGRFVIMRDPRLNQTEARTATVPPPIIPTGIAEETGGRNLNPAQLKAAVAAPTSAPAALPASDGVPPAPSDALDAARANAATDQGSLAYKSPYEDDGALPGDVGFNAAMVAAGAPPVLMPQPYDPRDADSGPHEIVNTREVPGTAREVPGIGAEGDVQGQYTPAPAPDPTVPGSLRASDLPDQTASRFGPPPTPQPTGMKPVWDALGNVVGYVQETASGAVSAAASNMDENRRNVERANADLGYGQVTSTPGEPDHVGRPASTFEVVDQGIRSVTDTLEPAGGGARMTARVNAINDQAAREQGRTDIRASIDAALDPAWRAQNPTLAAEYDDLQNQLGLNVMGQVGDTPRMMGRAGQALAEAATPVVRQAAESGSGLVSRAREGLQQGRRLAADLNAADAGGGAYGTFGITPGTRSGGLPPELIPEALPGGGSDARWKPAPAIPQEEIDQFRRTAFNVEKGRPAPEGAEVVWNEVTTKGKRGKESATVSLPFFRTSTGDEIPLPPPNRGLMGSPVNTAYNQVVAEAGGHKGMPSGRWTDSQGNRHKYDSPQEILFMAQYDAEKAAGRIKNWWRGDDNPRKELEAIPYVSTNRDKGGVREYRPDFIVEHNDGRIEVLEAKPAKVIATQEEYGIQGGKVTGKMGWDVTKKAAGIIPTLADQGVGYRLVMGRDSSALVPQVPRLGNPNQTAKSFSGVPGVDWRDVVELDRKLPSPEATSPGNAVADIINRTSTEAVELAQRLKRQGVDDADRRAALFRFVRERLLPTAEMLGREEGETRPIRTAVGVDAPYGVGRAGRQTKADLTESWPEAAAAIESAEKNGARIRGASFEMVQGPTDTVPRPRLFIDADGDPQAIQRLAAQLGETRGTNSAADYWYYDNQGPATVRALAFEGADGVTQHNFAQVQAALNAAGEGVPRLVPRYNKDGALATVHVIGQDGAGNLIPDEDVVIHLTRMRNVLQTFGIQADIGPSARAVVSNFQAEGGYANAIERREQLLGLRPVPRPTRGAAATDNTGGARGRSSAVGARSEAAESAPSVGRDDLDLSAVRPGDGSAADLAPPGLASRIREGWQEGRALAADANATDTGGGALATFGVSPNGRNRPTVEVLEQQLERARAQLDAAKRVGDTDAVERALDRARQIEGDLADARNARLDLEPAIASDVGRRIETLPRTADEADAVADAMRPQERVRPGQQADIGGPSSVIPETAGRMNATPGLGNAGSQALTDVSNSLGAGVFGAASGAAMPADSDEERRANAIRGAGIGMLAGPAAGRLMRRGGGALGSMGVGPNGEPIRQAKMAGMGEELIPPLMNSAPPLAPTTLPPAVAQAQQQARAALERAAARGQAPLSPLQWTRKFAANVGYSSMIGPATASVNVFGNALEPLWSIPKEAARAALPRAVGGRGNPREFAEMALGAFHGMGETGTAMLDAIMARGRYASNPDHPTLSAQTANPILRAMATATEAGGRVFSGMPDAIFGTIARGAGEARKAAQIATDEGLKGAGWKSRVSELLKEVEAQRGGALSTFPTEVDDIIKAGEKYADDQTFRTRLGTVGKGASSLAGRDIPVVGNLITPFFNTPWNMGVTLAERTPIGAVMNRQRGFDKAYDAVVGSALLTGLAVGPVAAGLVTGSGPADPEKRKMLEAEGWKPYHTLVGGYYVPNRVFGIYGKLLNAAGEVHDTMAYPKKDGDAMALGSDSLARFGKLVKEEPYLQGLADVLDLVSNPNTAGLERYAASNVTRMVPYGATARTVGTAMDPNDRTVERGKGVGFWEAVGQRVEQGVGIRSDSPVAQDVMGRPKENQQQGAWSLLPRFSQKKDDPLVRAYTDGGVDIGGAPDTVEGVKLTAAQQRQYTETMGRELQRLAGPRVTSDAWKNASPASRKMQLEMFQDLARDLAALSVQKNGGPQFRAEQRQSIIDKAQGR